MCGVKPRTFKPRPEYHQVYQELYRLYRELHDAFGTRSWQGNLYHVMKDLLQIRDRQLEKARQLTLKKKKIKK
jgi:L-ribulokinase